ncbi:hypothetical protein Peur_013144 [Populus x canadensis]|uniref:protein IQ-DOMAIN 20 n=1 Tax=Populus nigra TaxID=3691 RepID=UPI002B26A003|nr:protein IQ-DOMAIN 20 [Populus nigra]
MARKRVSRNWFDRVRRKFLRSSHRNIILNSKACSSHSDEITEAGDYEVFNSIASPPSKRELAIEDIAAITIQANFRGHLARRAFRALRSLVKLQALARGVHVRKQSRIALQCMHALVRLQVRIRARQLLGQCNDN